MAESVRFILAKTVFQAEIRFRLLLRQHACKRFRQRFHRIPYFRLRICLRADLNQRGARQHVQAEPIRVEINFAAEAGVKRIRRCFHL